MGGGQSLPDDVRLDMEEKFSHSFQGVRVHTGTEASESARTIGAKAYTLGSDVVFGAAVGSIAGRTVVHHRADYWALTPVATPGGVALMVTRTNF